MAGPLLEFETEMFLSLFGSDGLVVVAEGMGIDRILLQFMRVYSEQGSLVLLLNTTKPEQVTSFLHTGLFSFFFNLEEQFFFKNIS